MEIMRYKVPNLFRKKTLQVYFDQFHDNELQAPLTPGELYVLKTRTPLYADQIVDISLDVSVIWIVDTI